MTVFNWTSKRSEDEEAVTPLSVLSASYNQLGVCLTTVAWTIDRLTTGFVWLSRPFLPLTGSYSPVITVGRLVRSSFLLKGNRLDSTVFNSRWVLVDTTVRKGQFSTALVSDSFSTITTYNFFSPTASESDCTGLIQTTNASQSDCTRLIHTRNAS